MDVDTWLIVLSRRARNRGHEQRLIELLTRDPGASVQMAAYLECGQQLAEIAKELSPTAVEALALCGLSGSWMPVAALDALPQALTPPFLNTIEGH